MTTQAKGERMEMVERVARAICCAERMNPDDKLGGWIHWQDAARAAIAAMREPTEHMMYVGGSSFEDSMFANGSHVFDGAREAYRAMIDTALGGKG